MKDKVTLTFLGTGTSQGIPIIGCQCPVCKSVDPHDKRFRSSALFRYRGMTILVDAGPDFRMQMLRENVTHLDAVLLTHNHKDHTGGLDDLRALNYTDKSVVDIYCEQMVLSSIQKEYSYAFAKDKYPGAPEWRIHLIDASPFTIVKDSSPKELVWIHDVGYRYRLPDGTLVHTGESIVKADNTGDGAKVIPIRGYHDKMPVLGFRIGDIAYITDMSLLPEGEYSKLEGLSHLTLNTVGYKKHHSHFSIYEALDIAGRVGAKHTWLTHLNHVFPTHTEFCNMLDGMCRERGISSIVRPAYDGLCIEGE